MTGLALAEGESLADLVLAGISPTERELAMQYLERVGWRRVPVLTAVHSTRRVS